MDMVPAGFVMGSGARLAIPEKGGVRSIRRNDDG